MSTTQRLAPLLPLLPPLPNFPPEHFLALQAAGVHTVPHLLFTPLETLLTCLPAEIGTRGLEELRSAVAEVCGAEGTRAGDALHLPESADGAGSWGVRWLDEVIPGGGEGRVVELAGPDGSGKSLVATHLLVAHLLARPEHTTALWLDTRTAFNAQRCADVLDRRGGPREALDRVRVVRCFAVKEIWDALDTMRVELEATHEPPDPLPPRPSILMIDRLSNLLESTLTGPNAAQGNATLTSLLSHLLLLARTHSLTILLLNPPSTSSTTTSRTRALTNPHATFASVRGRPALYPSLAFGTDATVWIARGEEVFGTDPRDGKRKEGRRAVVLDVLRSRVGGSSAWAAFETVRARLSRFEEIVVKALLRDVRDHCFPS